MPQLKQVLVFLTLWTCGISGAYAAQCNNVSVNEADVNAGSTRSVLSPDGQWKFVIIARTPPGSAALYIENTRSSKKWNIGFLERSGMVVWSEDSRKVLLRDSYVADDTRIRAFEVARSAPKEIEGVDHRIRRAIFARIPENETIQWLYYPEVCFAAGDSSTIILSADLPLVPKRKSGKGKSFGLKLTVSLISSQIEITESDLFASKDWNSMQVRVLGFDFGDDAKSVLKSAASPVVAVFPCLTTPQHAIHAKPAL